MGLWLLLLGNQRRLCAGSEKVRGDKDETGRKERTEVRGRKGFPIYSKDFCIYKREMEATKVSGDSDII